MFAVLILGPTEIMIFVGVLVLLFGAKKIPELMRGLGQGVREFKSGFDEEFKAGLDEGPADFRCCLIVTPQKPMNRSLARSVRKVRLSGAKVVGRGRRVAPLSWVWMIRPMIVATAVDRTGAERALRRIRPVIAIIDLDLPDLEAFYLISYIKNTTGASIIALSSSGDDDADRRPWKSGVGASDGYLVKPFTEAQLLDLIRELLERRKRPPKEKESQFVVEAAIA